MGRRLLQKLAPRVAAVDQDTPIVLHPVCGMTDILGNPEGDPYLAPVVAESLTVVGWDPHGVLKAVHPLNRQVVDVLEPLGLELGARLFVADRAVGDEDEPQIPAPIIESGVLLRLVPGDPGAVLQAGLVPVCVLRVDGVDEVPPRSDALEHGVRVLLRPDGGVSPREVRNSSRTRGTRAEGARADREADDEQDGDTERRNDRAPPPAADAHDDLPVIRAFP